MPCVLQLEVPIGLGRVLLNDDFDEPYSGRSGGTSPETISAALVVAGSIASLGADSITVLVGLEQLSALIRHLRSWLRGQHGDSAELNARITRDGKTLTATWKIDGTVDEADADTIDQFGRTISAWLRS